MFIDQEQHMSMSSTIPIKTFLLNNDNVKQHNYFICKGSAGVWMGVSVKYQEQGGVMQQQ